ncbi:Mrp/NBP35 family ATP-binding protein [Blastococcus jejuensis]|uniref:Iron-sulfur cluster carrier protein n=1 Tax=Blastococcus jejuensis TaxID=351224 RepID=A0ABP6PP34_9ACTN
MSRFRRGADLDLDLAAIRDAVGRVEDPEIHRPIADLGMLGEVTARNGGVRVEVRLTTPTCPLRDAFGVAVTAAVHSVAPGAVVEVVFGALDERARRDLSARLRGPERGIPVPAPRIYAVASGKGGVGKSSVTANLAVALADQGLSVGLLDADVWGYSVPHLFGTRRAPVALSGLMFPVEAHGVRLMSTGFLVPEDEPVVWRGPMLHKALEQFLADVHWGDLDVLLLDLPPGTGDITLSLLELVPSAALLAVTTPQPAARVVASRVGRMAKDARMPVAGVVENMSAAVCEACGHGTALFGSGGGAQLAGEMGVPLLAQVPLDAALREAGDAGVPVVRRDPTAASAQVLRQLAADLPVVRRSLVGVPLPLSVA